MGDLGILNNWKRKNKPWELVLALEKMIITEDTDLQINILYTLMSSYFMLQNSSLKKAVSFQSHESSLCHIEVQGVVLKLPEILTSSFQLGVGRRSRSRSCTSTSPPLHSLLNWQRANGSLTRPDLVSWCATATKTPFVLLLDALKPLEQKCVGNLSQPIWDSALVFSWEGAACCCC